MGRETEGHPQVALASLNWAETPHQPQEGSPGPAEQSCRESGQEGQQGRERGPEGEMEMGKDRNRQTEGNDGDAERKQGKKESKV